ncbi:hypothetical protein LCGC14_3062170 [marine sediment metagenome]|uniref:Uncharacterized protein n=1 Tax=marine sediment metagenome TaxID=412755 RepID=A0A0F8YRB0_9ZZZZ
MQNVSTIETSVRVVVVRELKVGDLRQMMPKIKEAVADNMNMSVIRSEILELIKKATDLKIDELDDFYFTDIEKIENAVRAINVPLFRYYKSGKNLLLMLGLEAVAPKVIEKLAEAFLLKLDLLDVEKEMEEAQEEQKPQAQEPQEETKIEVIMPKAKIEVKMPKDSILTSSAVS